jgi:hypothetical protein
MSAGRAGLKAIAHTLFAQALAECSIERAFDRKLRVVAESERTRLIVEMNCVRKHFSAVKGGRLADSACRLRGLNAAPHVVILAKPESPYLSIGSGAVWSGRLKFSKRRHFGSNILPTEISEFLWFEYRNRKGSVWPRKKQLIK